MNVYKRYLVLSVIIAGKYCFSIPEGNVKSLTLVDENSVVASQHRALKPYGLYMRACYRHKKGDLGGALALYKQLIAQDHSVEVYDGFIRLLSDMAQFPAIVTLFEEKKQLFDQKFKDNLDMQLTYAQALLYVGRQSEAEKTFAELAERYKDSDIVAYYTAVSLLKSDNPEKVLRFIEQCLHRPALKNKYFLFHFLASKVYLQMKQPEKALASINQSLKHFPKFDQALLFKAVLLEQQGKINEAIAGYSDFLDIAGRDSDIEKQLIQLLFKQKRFSEAADRLRKMKGDQPEHFFDLALIELHAKRYSKALSAVNKSLDKRPTFTKARLLKLEILLESQKEQEALSLVQSWLTSEPDNLSVIHILSLLKKAHISVKKLITVVKNVLNEKTSVLLHTSLADMYVEIHDYLQANDHYKKALVLTQDSEIKTKLAYQAAYTYVKMTKYQEAKELLRNLIQDSAYPAAYNLLAYVYAQQEETMAEALKLIDKALAKEPQRAEFLDTKGYVLRKMGKKQEAVVMFKKALYHKPKDRTIKQHLKECNAR